MTEIRTLAAPFLFTASLAMGCPSAPLNPDAGAADAAALGDAPRTPDAGASNRCSVARPADPRGEPPTPPAFFTRHPGAQVQNQGGPVLTAPRIVPIFFPGDPLQAQLDDFVGTVGCTDYWRAVVGEYGVGDAIAAPAVVASEAPPGRISDVEIGAWLRAQIEAGTVEARTPNSVYVLFYPQGTTVTEGPKVSCRQFYAFHNSVTLADGQEAAFAVVPRCASLGDLAGLDLLSTFTSHELVEAAVDPVPVRMPAWFDVDHNHLGLRFFGGETTDLCQVSGVFHFQPAGFPYEVARSYSNYAARAGTDPCAPASSDPYFTAAPTLTDGITSMEPGGPVVVPAVMVAPGETRVVDIEIYSESPTQRLTLVQDDLSAFIGMPPGTSTYTFDHEEGVSGDIVHLTITAPATAMAGSTEARSLAVTNGTYARIVAIMFVAH